MYEKKKNDIKDFLGWTSYLLVTESMILLPGPETIWYNPPDKKAELWMCSLPVHPPPVEWFLPRTEAPAGRRSTFKTRKAGNVLSASCHLLPASCEHIQDYFISWKHLFPSPSGNYWEKMSWSKTCFLILIYFRHK